ncbi:hypothetical protein [Chromatium okenii]|uniref:Uncharacterized protein n=1 Tax=Chromatium okenii TaxID=61644 RepID=A0A2S7XT09_9GAMM|nr:hypothetical protein [Chromatium okenii]PQJ96860.1 hypothetical protein CXB77_05450 [Chromatium okenii]
MIDEIEQKIIVLIKTLRETGQSLQKIADVLTAQGYTTEARIGIVRPLRTFSISPILSDSNMTNRQQTNNRIQQQRLRDRRKEEGWKRVTVWVSPEVAIVCKPLILI